MAASSIAVLRSSFTVIPRNAARDSNPFQANRATGNEVVGRFWVQDVAAPTTRAANLLSGD